MAVLTTSTDAATGGVKIEFVEPASNGLAIDVYDIEIKQEGSTSYSATASCSGSDSAIISSKSCIVPMTELGASPHDYSTLGTIIVVRARAHNSDGYGSYSQDNTAGA